MGRYLTQKQQSKINYLALPHSRRKKRSNTQFMNKYMQKAQSI